MTATVAVTFLILAVLLLWVVIFAQGHWHWKLPLIIVVPAFMFALWFSLASFSGYPTRAHLPKKALFVAGYYVDPDPATHEKGAIYMWLILPSTKSHNFFGYDAEITEPRAYVLPYSEQIAEQIQKAMQQTRKGNAVEVRVKTQGKGRRGPHGTGQGGRLEAYVLPPPAPPMKHH